MTSVSPREKRPPAKAPASILNPEHLRARLEDIKARMGPPPWSTPLIITAEMQAIVIYQAPGTPNDRHFHLHDEWWAVMEGEISWQMEGRDEPVIARAGDFVFAPKSTFHYIQVLGDKPAVRIGIGAVGEFHRHEK